MTGEMEFGVLGPLVVRSGGTDVPVPRGSQRVIVAALLLRANRVVSAGALTQALWGDEPPPSAPAALRNHVRRLRQALGQPGAERIVTQAPGYLIRVGDRELDLSRFEQLLNSARAAARARSWEVAASQAREALELWRGEPLADAESAALQAQEAPRLFELRVQAAELNLEAQLYLGSQAEAAAELARLAAAHPLREHVQALLMLALYRCGRQAEALGAYQQARRMLVEQLGAEPGTELKNLHQQILAADPALDVPLPAAEGGVTEPAGAASPAVIPRQLPAAVAQFTGRAAELQALAEALNLADAGPGTVVISAIGGMAGVGKTALAVHFAHQVAGQFPDGQLYVNLRGFDPSGTPAAPAVAIRGFLDALGLPAEHIPPDAAAQEGLYRSLMARRRMLIMLDNAHDEQQVRALLPASPGTLVLVTSRSQLSGLAAVAGARLLSLDVLTHAEATRMLACRIGAQRAAAEPDAVAAIGRLCASLPLALAVTAARAAARPGFRLAALAAELRDAERRLDALDAGDPAASVRAVFSWSYQQLAPDTARMFWLLSLHPGPDISAPAAASLAGIAPAQARHQLAELARAHLITEHVPGRYAFHDLLRAYATDRARSAGCDTSQQQATGRLLDHYLHTGDAAALLLDEARIPITLAEPAPGVTPERLADRQQAMTWFDAEHRVLAGVISLAANSGSGRHGWQIPWTMADFLERRGNWHEWAAIEQTALAAATRLDDVAGQAVSCRLLARACGKLGDCDQALIHLAECLPLYQRLGDRLGEASVYQARSLVSGQLGRYADSLDDARRALVLFQASGDATGQAEALNNIGYTHVLLGDYERARESCQQALILCQQGDCDRYVEAYTCDSLAYAEHHLGHHIQASDSYARALRIARELDDRFLEAVILTHLGDLHHDSDGPDAARISWQQALDILSELEHSYADEVRAKLSAADGDFAGAR